MRKFVKQETENSNWLVGLEDNDNVGYLDPNFSLILNLTEAQADEIIKSLYFVYKMARRDKVREMAKFLMDQS